MKNKGIIIAFLLLSYAVIISLFSGFNVSADTKTYNGFEYIVEENKVTITNYVGTDINLILPSHIDNFPIPIM